MWEGGTKGGRCRRENSEEKLADAEYIRYYIYLCKTGEIANCEITKTK